MKIGDKVIIKDHSWHSDLDCERGRPYHMADTGGIHTGDDCIVVAVNCSFPPMDYCETFSTEPGKQSDVLLFNRTKKIFMFFRSNQLQKIGEVCPICFK